MALPAAAYRGRVIDASTGRGLAHALATSRDQVVETDESGLFTLTDPVERIAVRAPGYARTAVDVATLPGDIPEIALQPFAPKGLYLSLYGIATAALRDPALELIETTELNADHHRR